MFAWASLLENAGEPAIESQYRDPAALRDLGYTGAVLYATTALSGLAKVDQVRSTEIRSWLDAQIAALHAKIDAYRSVGMDVFASLDALVLPKDVIERGGPSMRCRGRTALCPAAEPAWEAVMAGVRATLRRWPQLTGIVVRFGDHDADRLPHLAGNDLYTPHCPRCSGIGRADRITDLVHRYRKVVVEEFDKTLVVRAWNVRPGGLHDHADLASAVAAGLDRKANDGKTIFSFKFTQTDFWRYQPWNPSSLSMGDWPVVYELQCQREFEGKGGVPDWQPPLWRDGMPEVAPPAGGRAKAKKPVVGLADAAKHANVVGLWAWVRGGGWGGPFVGDERWIDANVAAVPQLAKDPARKLGDLADHWLKQRLGIKTGPLRKALRRVLVESPEVVLRAFYLEAYAATRPDAWHPNGDWVQDDNVDAEALWRIIQRLPDAKLDAVVGEKQDAAARIVDLRAELQRAVGDRQHPTLEPLVNTLLYAEALFEAWRDLADGLVAYRRFKAGLVDGRLVVQRLAAAQSHWNHHAQRFSALPGTATAFRERGLWDLTQRLLEDAAAG
ncbi:MAG: hypothetical protein AAFY08_00525 [Planctomycetota bacterium]